ncbi:MAG: PTS sugar transporter subunit IIC [Alphaproteobacteria bacterium]|jgi:PTS system cellobiose-specific IIC component|nr:PTS sugar transporter subunit IIC [Alphaproteobacteria bacterium]
MKSFLTFMENHFVPIAAKIGGQRHLVVIRDSFAVAMPLILVGAFAVLLNGIWSAFGSGVDAAVRNAVPWLFELNGIVWWGTFAIFSLFMVVSVAYRLAQSYNEDGLLAGVISLAAFVMQLPQLREINGDMAWGWITVGDLGITSLFAAIIIAIVITEIYVRLIKMNLTIKLPDSVPPAVSRSFTALIPGAIVLYLAGAVSLILSKNAITIGGGEINNLIGLIGALLQAPFMTLGQSLWTILIISLFIPLFWFTGLHGANIVAPVINAVYLPAVLENANALQAGLPMPNLWTSVSWDVFVHFGGAGATLALIIAIYLVSKRDDYKAIAKIGTAPGVFMINEPVMFGLPVVLNPYIFIPFVLNPIILTLIAYLATAAGLVPPTSVVVPWTTPPVIGAFLATGGSVSAAILAAFNFVLAIIMYIPFIILANKR